MPAALHAVLFARRCLGCCALPGFTESMPNTGRWRLQHLDRAPDALPQSAAFKVAELQQGLQPPAVDGQWGEGPRLD